MSNIRLDATCDEHFLYDDRVVCAGRSALALRDFWEDHSAKITDRAFLNHLLDSAVKHDCREIVTTLMQRGGDPNKALEAAALHGNNAIIHHILYTVRENRLDNIHIPSNELFFSAAQAGSVEVLQKLEYHGFYINTQNPIRLENYAYDLLTYAATRQSHEVAMYLKRKGLKVANSNTTTGALDDALKRGSLRDVDGLLAVGSKTASPSALGCAMDRAFLTGQQAWLWCFEKHNIEFFSPIVAKTYHAANAKPDNELGLVESYQETIVNACTEAIGVEPDDVLLPSSWVNHCMFNHKICTMPGTVVPALPKRVIDIFSPTPFLVETRGQRGLYATLSHCWKSSASVITTAANIDRHKESFKVDDFSKTFQKAIAIARSMGFAYLWIDALCILQDSKEDWEVESEKMADIYQNAVVNIAIEDGSNVTGSEDLIDTAAETGVRPDGSLDERAWIMQEKLLAPRTVTFCREGVYWDCAVTSASNKYPDGIPISLDKHFKLRENRIFREIVRTGTLVSANQDVREKLSTSWKRVVEEYSSRKLSHESDKLIAIQGLANAMQTVSGDLYLSGLWYNHLWTDLLWKVNRNAFSTGSQSLQTRRKDLSSGIPSWTWASVRDCVSYEWPAATNHYPATSSLTSTSFRSSSLKGGMLLNNCLVVGGKVRHLDRTKIRKEFREAQAHMKSMAHQLQWYPNLSNDKYEDCTCIEVARSKHWVWSLVLVPLGIDADGQLLCHRTGLVMWVPDRFDKLLDVDIRTVSIL